MKMMRKRMSTPASIRVIIPSYVSSASPTIISSANGMSVTLVLRLIARGKITEVAPSTNNMFAILLPIIFPRAISPTHCTAASTLTTSSGTDVPSATSVRPTTIGDTFILLARDEEPSTSQSAPLTRRIKPITNKI